MGEDAVVEHGLCFVISPIGDDGSAIRRRADDVLNFIVRPAATLVGLDAVRADESDKPGGITADVIEKIVTAKVIVADLTGSNPNVFFELGVADAYQKPVVLLIDAAREMPFDKVGERVIELGGSKEVRIGASDCPELIAKLQRALQITISPTYEVKNVVASAGISRGVDSLARHGDPIAAQLELLTDAISQLARKFRAQEQHELEMEVLRQYDAGLRVRPWVPGAMTTSDMDDQVARTAIRSAITAAIGRNFDLQWADDTKRVTLRIERDRVVTKIQADALAELTKAYGYQFGGVQYVTTK